MAVAREKERKRDRCFIFVKFTIHAYPPPAPHFAYTDVLFYLTGKDVCCGNFFLGAPLWRNF